MSQFGRAWSISMQPSDPPPAGVPPRILSKLALYTPPKELVDAYLGEIAKSYGVPYEVAGPMEKLEDDADKSDPTDDQGDGAGAGAGAGGPGEGQNKEKETDAALAVPAIGQGKKSPTKEASPKKQDEASLPDLSTPAPVAAAAPPKKVNEDDELAKRFERLKNLK